MGWATKQQARDHWPDAAAIADATLDTLLSVATIGCAAYAPTLDPRTVTDGVTTNASPTVTSATAGFTAADTGRQLTGTGLPAGATILDVVDAQTVTLSANATANGTGVSVTVKGRPLNYMLGCVYQAREVYSASVRDGDVIGVGDYAIRARPLTGSVKALLRPPSGALAVG